MVKEKKIKISRKLALCIIALIIGITLFCIYPTDNFKTLLDYILVVFGTYALGNVGSHIADAIKK